MESIAKNWWISLLFGVLFLFAGFWVFRIPQESYITLSIVFSVFILVSGIFEIAFTLSNRDEIQGWGWYFTGGILDLIIGGLLISHPAMNIAILPIYVGFWLLFRSTMSTGFAFSLNSAGVANWGWLLVARISTLLLIIFLFRRLQASMVYSQEVKTLFSQSINSLSQVFHKSQLDELPEPVQ